MFMLSEKVKNLKESAAKLAKENDEMEALQVRLERERESLQMTNHELEEALQDAEVSNHRNIIYNGFRHLVEKIDERMHILPRLKPNGQFPILNATMCLWNVGDRTFPL